ncbi:MAG: CopG family transcriptional regulator [Planctomycetota bacterium]
MKITIPDSPELTARIAAEGFSDAEAYVHALVAKDLEVAAIMEGVADVEAGRVQPADEAFREIRAEIAAAKERSAAAATRQA